MRSKEKAVREAAEALHEAISDAVAGGYNVGWPANADGLPGIMISETGKVPAKDYESMLRSELVDIAVEKGIDVKSDWNKSDLVTAIEQS